MKEILASQVDLKLHLELLKDKKALEAIAILTGDQDLMPLKLTEYKAIILRLDYLESINDELLEAAKDALEYFESFGPGPRGFENMFSKHIDELEKAIAKAESK